MSFNRLYKEINESLIYEAPQDLRYRREISELTSTLLLPLLSPNKNRNLEIVSVIKAPVKPSKFHGKLARIQTTLNEDKRANELLKETRRNKQRELREFELSHPLNSHGTLNDLKNMIEKKEFIPKRMLEKMLQETNNSKLKNESLKSPNMRLKLLAPINQPTEQSIALNPLDSNNRNNLLQFESTRSFGHGSLKVSKSFTNNKWSSEERQRLYLLYSEVPLPPKHAQSELWGFYFSNIARKFLVFFPTRSESEVIKKIKEMLSNRQFKEKGEDIYWRRFQLQNTA